MYSPIVPVPAAAAADEPDEGRGKEEAGAEQGQEGEARAASNWRTREMDSSSKAVRRCFSTSSASMASGEGFERPGHPDACAV